MGLTHNPRDISLDNSGACARERCLNPRLFLFSKVHVTPGALPWRSRNPAAEPRGHGSGSAGSFPRALPYQRLQSQGRPKPAAVTSILSRPAAWHRGADTLAPVLEKKKGFYCKSTCKETGGQAPVWLPHPGAGSVRAEGRGWLGKLWPGACTGSFGVRWGRGFSSTHLPSGRVPAFKFCYVLAPWFRGDFCSGCNWRSKSLSGPA